MLELATLMHYAVKKTTPYLEPACVLNRTELKLDVKYNQGMTVNRGKVTCNACLFMMGDPTAIHPTHDMQFVLSDVFGDVCQGCKLCACHGGSQLSRICPSIYN